MYRISKQFTFSASHALFRLPAGHQCRRLHGHNYVVEVVLQGEELDTYGFVRDYGELDKFKAWLDSVFDHRHLNDVLKTEAMEGFELSQSPTAELLARYMFATWVGAWPDLHAIGISETPKTWAWYIKPQIPGVFQ